MRPWRAGRVLAGVEDRGDGIDVDSSEGIVMLLQESTSPITYLPAAAGVAWGAVEDRRDGREPAGAHLVDRGQVADRVQPTARESGLSRCRQRLVEVGGVGNAA